MMCDKNPISYFHRKSQYSQNHLINSLSFHPLTYSVHSACIMFPCVWTYFGLSILSHHKEALLLTFKLWQSMAGLSHSAGPLAEDIASFASIVWTSPCSALDLTEQTSLPDPLTVLRLLHLTLGLLAAFLGSVTFTGPLPNCILPHSVRSWHPIQIGPLCDWRPHLA